MVSRSAGALGVIVNRPFNCGLLSSHFLASLLSTGTAVALAPLELVGVAETGRARLTYDC
jgi:hypothetical protein